MGKGHSYYYQGFCINLNVHSCIAHPAGLTYPRLQPSDYDAFICAQPGTAVDSFDASCVLPLVSVPVNKTTQLGAI